MTSHYFAYGSNMNPERVRHRKMPFRGHAGGVLADYRLAFNKRSVKYRGAASANVIAAPGDRVEGVLYELAHPTQIEFMDPFEGYPVRYTRLSLPIACGDTSIDAWVYIANESFVVEGLKPARWYLGHLLCGRDFLSEAYYDQLALVECLPDSEVEPA